MHVKDQSLRQISTLLSPEQHVLYSTQEFTVLRLGGVGGVSYSRPFVLLAMLCGNRA